MTRNKRFVRSGSLVLLLLLALFATLPLVKVGFILLGHRLSPQQRTTPPHSIWPSHETRISTLTPTIRWPAREATRYEVTLSSGDERGRIIHRASSDDGRLPIPVGLLADDQSYSWRATPTGTPDGLAFAGDFRTGTRVRRGQLVVSPSVYNISLQAYREGIKMDIDAPREALVELVLPGVLTAGGTRLVAMTGGFQLVVRPALELAMLSPEALSSSSLLGEIVVRSETDEVRVPVRFDVSDQGRFLRSVVSGFDPLLDTPAFANFAQGVLATVTRGTCLGMVLAAQQSYLGCRECAEKRDCWCPRLRLRSLMNPEMVKEEMNFLHLANFSPLNWSTAVTSTLTEASQPEVVGHILGRLRDRHPVALALLDHAVESGGPALGHAVLAYAAHEFEDHTIFFVFDPDRVATSGDPLRSFIVVPRASSPGAPMHFQSVGGEERVEVHALPDANLLTSLTPRLAGVFSTVDRELVRSINGQ
jgi:hypothetical protein